MTGMEIVREETRRMLRGMIPLAVIVFGVFLLAGADPCLLYTSWWRGHEAVVGQYEGNTAVRIIFRFFRTVDAVCKRDRDQEKKHAAHKSDAQGVAKMGVERALERPQQNKKHNVPVSYTHL